MFPKAPHLDRFYKFYAFINDILYFIKEGTLYNYAHDNTLSFCHENFDKLVSVLQEESHLS